MDEHSIYMRQALELAIKGLGSTSPNPMVGAILVCDGSIIGQGYHQKFGEAHAEVGAIQTAFTHNPHTTDRLKRSTLYVTLEPCSHFGKTPPCADLIIQHQIPRVVVGCRDPFPQVNGKGIERLKNAGIDVIEGVLQDECQDLNKRFFTCVQKQRPYIILKWAQTGDGFFAPKDGSQKWITSTEAKQLVHRWRSEEDAVLVGKATALTDNPQLNVREWTGRNPKRIIIDKHLTLPKHLHLFDQSIETIVFNALKTTIDGNTKYIQLEDFDYLLPQHIAYQLYLMDIQSVIIEGGTQTLDLFIQADLWDEARIFTGPQTWGEGIKAPILPHHTTETIQVEADKLNFVYHH